MTRAIAKALFLGLVIALALGTAGCFLRAQPVGRNNAQMRSGDDDHDHGRRRGHGRRDRDDDHDDHDDDDDDDHDDHDDD